MTESEAMKIIRSLACSQGFYGRLLQAIEETPKAERTAAFKKLL